MSILTDFILAKAGNENAILEAEDFSDEFKCIQLSGVDTVKLQTLYSIIKGESPSEIEALDFSPFEGCADEGPWLFKIPLVFQNALVNTTDSDLERVAKAWSQTDEVEMDGWSLEDTTEVINDISSLAKEAKETESELFLLISL